MSTRFRPTLHAAAILIMCVIAALPARARTERGQATLGPKVGYVSRNNSVVAGLQFEYSLSSVVRIAPEAAVIFRHKDMDGFVADLNIHFPISMGSKANFYPLAGLAYTSWGRHGYDEETEKDVTNRTNIFGLNMGAGIECYCMPSLKLSLEAKYALMRHYPTAYVTAAIAFVF